MNEEKVVSLEEFDLVASSEQPFELELVSPKTDRPMGVFISVLGDNAKAVQKYVRGEVNRRRHDEAMKAKRGRTDEVANIEDDVDFAVESCVVRTVGWRGIKEQFTKENARKLYVANPKIRLQVLEASNNAANFSKA